MEKDMEGVSNNDKLKENDCWSTEREKDQENLILELSKFGLQREVSYLLDKQPPSLEWQIIH